MNTLRRRWLEYLLLIASLVFVFVATLAPFDFVIPERVSLEIIIAQFQYVSGVKDYWRNILFFIPFGISLARILPQNQLSAGAIFSLSLLASLGLSTTVETLQFFLPERVSNFTDIATNTLGGGLGFLLYWWRREIIDFFAALLTRKRSQLSLKSLSLAFISYFAGVYLAIFILLISVNLNNWSEDFPLIIGNEATGDRPWQGYISQLQICDRAMSPLQVSKVFNNSDLASSRFDNSCLVAAYNFGDRSSGSRDNSYLDLSSNRANLVWQDEAIANINDNFQAVEINRGRWLKTENQVANLIHQLQQSDELTLSTIIAPKNIFQTGPARIVSISQDSFHRNLTLAQEKSDLVFRLRTPLTGDNASEPELIVPNVFKNTDFHQILITFNRQDINFYIDKSEPEYTFAFEPEITFLSYYPLVIPNWQINLNNFNKLLYRLIFYGIIFIPLGILGGIILTLFPRKLSSQILLIGSICGLPALSIEQLYANVTAQPIRSFNLLLGIAILFTTSFITKSIYPKNLKN